MVSYILHEADCRDAMLWMEDASVDAVVTDPPYELGFMGKGWDASGIAYDVAMWREVLRVLKPGGHLLAFSGSRTYHRMVVAIEDAGFEIRDQIMWLYGSGFPKSLDVSKAIDKAAGATREVIGQMKRTGKESGTYGAMAGDNLLTAPATPEALRWQGWGTALKPAHEPIVVARKPLIGTVANNILAHGTGALNVDGCRVTGDGPSPSAAMRASGKAPLSCKPGEYGSTIQNRISPERWLEPKPGEALGRWPANVIHDGSDEVLAGFPGAESRFFYCPKASKADRNAGCEGMPKHMPSHGKGHEAGGLQVSNSKRPSENNHPTVKPNELMRYLCRLVTPPGGTVFDPFTGSGSTGKAAVAEGFDFIGCEMTPEYVPIARARIEAALDPLS